MSSTNKRVAARYFGLSGLTAVVTGAGSGLGRHVRCGIEDHLWDQARAKKMSTVEQIEQLVRISREFGRKVATAQEAREISKIGVFYDTVEETLQANGFAPNRKGGNQGFLRKAV
jgi:hypothetical protein